MHSDDRLNLLKHNNQSGFTLLEIIVSTIIFALIITGLVNIFVAAKKLGRHTRSRMQATQIGRHFLDPLQTEVSEDQWDTNCLGTGVCADEYANIDGIRYTASYNTTDIPNTMLRRARVNITWSEPE